MTSARTDVVQISLPTPFAIGRVNCFLLAGDPLTLVDTGPNASEALEALEVGLGKIGLQIEQVQLVLLTHQHYDHVGLARTVKERSGCIVVAHELLAGFLREFENSMDSESFYQTQVMRLHGVPDEIIDRLRWIDETYRCFGNSVEVDRPVRDGDLIEAGEHRLRAYLRPGHSPTDTIFIDESTRTAFVGDLLLGRITSNAVVHRPLDRVPDIRRRTSSLVSYLASLGELAEFDLDVLYPGHGDPISGHRALVAQRLEFHGRRNERVLQELSRGPRTAHAVARAICGDIPTTQVYFALSEVIGALDILLELIAE